MGREKAEANDIMEDAGQVEVVETAAQETPAKPEAEKPALTLIDNMTEADGDTLFSVSKGGNTANLAYDFGADLTAMTEKFGEDIVFKMAKSQMIVRAQAVARPFIEKGISAITALAEWVPGVKRIAAPVDKKANATEFLKGFSSAEELKAFLDENGIEL